MKKPSVSRIVCGSAVSLSALVPTKPLAAEPRWEAMFAVIDLHQVNYLHRNSRMRMLNTVLLFTVLMLCIDSVSAQRSPSDLADIPLNELLNIRVANAGELNTVGDAPALDDLGVASRFSFWYRYRKVQFKGYRSGKQDLSNAEVLKMFPVLPTVINQQAQILGINYRHSNRLDFTFSIPRIEQSTEHIRRSGGPFTLHSEDWGDLSTAANYSVFKYGRQAVVLTLGINAPTGTIDAKGDTPRGKGTQLPYAMQIGSGTWDLHSGMTYATSREPWNIGATLDTVVRLGRNDRNYRLGDQASLTLWAERSLTSRIKFLTLLRGERWGDIDGQDAEVNPLIAPVADPMLYGGSQVDVGGSFRFQWKEDVYDNYYIELGGAVPVWQDLNGPQPKQQWEISLAIGIGFE